MVICVVVALDSEFIKNVGASEKVVFAAGVEQLRNVLFIGLVALFCIGICRNERLPYIL